MGSALAATPRAPLSCIPSLSYAFASCSIVFTNRVVAALKALEDSNTDTVCGVSRRRPRALFGALDRVAFCPGRPLGTAPMTANWRWASSACGYLQVAQADFNESGNRRPRHATRRPRQPGTIDPWITSSVRTLLQWSKFQSSSSAIAGAYRCPGLNMLTTISLRLLEPDCASNR
jgi:hypothetical protein